MGAMRICVIGLRGIPNVAGGIETHCENLYDHIARSHSTVKVTVFGRRQYIGKHRYVTSGGVNVVPTFAIRNKYLETLSNTFCALFQARFVEKADLVHLHAIGPGLLAPLARLLGMRVILTHHGDDFAREKWNRFARIVLQLGERVGVSAATKTIAVSPSLAKRLQKTKRSNEVSVEFVPNGADHIAAHSLAANGAAVLRRYGLQHGKYIVAVGRLVPEKGFADLIKAHQNSLIKLPLVIVGGPSNSNHDQELMKACGKNVYLTGSLPQAEVAHLLAQARLFVMPSHHEGLPIAALEAWAMGAPLLISDIQPNRDLGLPGKHYFPVGDIDVLARKLQSDAHEFSTIPLPELYTWSRIAERTIAIYDELTTKHQTRSEATSV